jgi:hypothetical protein
MSRDPAITELLLRHSRACSLEAACKRLHTAVNRGEAGILQVRRACAAVGKPLAEEVPRLQHTLQRTSALLSALEQVLFRLLVP